LTFPKATRPEYFAASFSTRGSIILHGPHHTAQKSMKTTGLSVSILSNAPSVTATDGNELGRFQIWN
jgi:hypothetical protein